MAFLPGQPDPDREKSPVILPLFIGSSSRGRFSFFPSTSMTLTAVPVSSFAFMQPDEHHETDRAPDKPGTG